MQEVNGMSQATIDSRRIAAQSRPSLSQPALWFI
jgi:hypothetical protein